MKHRLIVFCFSACPTFADNPRSAWKEGGTKGPGSPPPLAHRLPSLGFLRPERAKAAGSASAQGKANEGLQAVKSLVADDQP